MIADTDVRLMRDPSAETGLAPPSPEDLEPTEKIGLRIPVRLLLVAKTLWLDGGERVQPRCQRLLEAALNARADEAAARARAAANGTIGDLTEPLQNLAPVDYSETSQLTVQLSRYAVEIAENLGRRKGGSLSIQKICEPLLCHELRLIRKKAVAAAKSILDELEDPHEKVGGT